jgi:LVIVD repeat
MIKHERASALAIAVVALPGLLLSASIALAKEVSGPLTGSVPRAICGPADHTESGLQGQTTPQERSSGDSERAYNCNLELVGQYQGEGNYSQDGPAYAGNCAYFGTDRITNLQQHLGMTVIDASDPQHPQASAYLNDTAAALAPHETPKVNAQRGLLAVGQLAGPNFAVYDISADCRHPVLKGSINLPGSIGHQGNFAPDGMTFYLTQNFFGIGANLYIVDLSDPSNLKELPSWQFLGDGRPHEAWLNAAGTRLYAGQPGLFGNPLAILGPGPNGLVIEDVSDYQFRRPNPQIRIISKLFWDDQGTAEPMYPFSSKGRQYLVSADESGGNGGVGGAPAACARGASPHGYPNIIDITDETNPTIVAKLRLEVSDPANCAVMLNDPPEVGGAIPGYNEERCVTDRPNNPTMLACAFQMAGLRVFDIRDLSHPKEIAYWKPGAVRTAFLPGSLLWNPIADRTMDRVAGYPRFFIRNPGNGKANGNGNGNGEGNGNGAQLELWIVGADNGFQILRFTDTFKALHKDLFDDSGD